MSRKVNEQAFQIIGELNQLSGIEFDRRFAENELSYHQTVNTTALSATPVAAVAITGTPFLQLSGSALVLVQTPERKPVDQITKFINFTIYPEYPDRNYSTITSYKMLMTSKDFGGIMFNRPGELLVQITNQDRAEYFMTLNQFTGFTTFPEHFSLKLSRSNLVNSPFARFFASKVANFVGN